MTSRRFALPGFRGEAAESFAVADLAAEAARLADPAAATKTIHWGRNYLYLARSETAEGPLEVVVKQFRPPAGWRARIGWHLAGEGKAARSWRIARALHAAGIPTPEPLLLLESESGRAASVYVSRHLAGRVEARYLLRARNAGREGAEFPSIDFAAFLAAAARLARRLHDAGFWHRDFSIGNLLVLPGPTPAEIAEIALVDLNRCRAGRPVTLGERMRDLSRLAFERREDRRFLLALYFGGERAAPARAWVVYELSRRSFHGRHRVKNRWRAAWASLESWLVPRGAHPHIPLPPAGAGPRDRIVWDALSDQPHSHAGRIGRFGARIADLPDHLRSVAALAGAVPRIRRRYRELAAARNAAPFLWPGAGVALRPWPADPEALLDAVFSLGVRQALLRLHPWQGEHAAEEALARELAGAGLELTFALPQSRELVRDPPRWRAAIEELAERFAPYGARFQIGQAINRSKWGVWSYGEYLELAAAAAAILRRRPGVEIAGPAVIDFEAHATAMVLNRRHPTLRFDALASLLYVDRRGAPESRQLGFDTVDKVTMLGAIAETSRLVAGRRQWITEVNWPLAEGPHSPAGRRVAVDEETQADYLARFYLLALASGYVERIFWWQLVARGYGLIDPGAAGELRRRPAYAALATLVREVPADSQCHGPLSAPGGARLYRFARPDGGEVVAGWSIGAPLRAPLPAPVVGAVGRDGAPLALAGAAEVELASGVRYFRL
ncbi:MAG TPA: lipopolysaccharide kinase InaA family protein [Thermoanaerobaculia bacterium]